MTDANNTTGKTHFLYVIRIKESLALYQRSALAVSRNDKNGIRMNELDRITLAAEAVKESKMPVAEIAARFSAPVHGVKAKLNEDNFLERCKVLKVEVEAASLPRTVKTALFDPRIHDTPLVRLVKFAAAPPRHLTAGKRVEIINEVLSERSETAQKKKLQQWIDSLGQPVVSLTSTRPTTRVVTSKSATKDFLRAAESYRSVVGDADSVDALTNVPPTSPDYAKIHDVLQAINPGHQKISGSFGV